MGKGKKGGGGARKSKQKKGGGGASRGRNVSPSAVRKKTGNAAFPVTGLMNLGNTCFFNSVMQSLGQTEYLRCKLNALLTGSQEHALTLRVEEKQLEVVVSEAPGQLTKTLQIFMNEIARPAGRALNPRPLFSQICEKAPRFRGYQQQDSQELLRYLLDSLKMEEANRIKRGILMKFNVTSQKNAKNITEDDRKMIKMFGNAVYRQQTYVDDVFGGMLVSTITCSECHHCSTIHENYLDLSLPVPMDESVRRSKAKRGREQNETDQVSGHTDTGSLTSLKGEEVEEMHTAMSKHQLKKARKKVRKGRTGKHSLQELQSMLSDAGNGTKQEKENTEEGEEMNTERETESVRGDCGEGGDGEGVRGEAERAVKSEGEAGEDETILTAAKRETEKKGEGEGENSDLSPQPAVCSVSEAPENTNVEPGEAILPNEGVKPAHQEAHLPEETTATEESTNDASPRQLKQATPPLEQPLTCIQVKEEATPTTNQPLTSNDIREDSLEGCLRKFCSPELLSGINQFYCAVCTQRRATERASAANFSSDASTAATRPASGSPPVVCSTACERERNCVDSLRNSEEPAEPRENEENCASKCLESSDSAPLQTGSEVQTSLSLSMQPTERDRDTQSCGSCSYNVLTSHCSEGNGAASSSDLLTTHCSEAVGDDRDAVCNELVTTPNVCAGDQTGTERTRERATGERVNSAMSAEPETEEVNRAGDGEAVTTTDRLEMTENEVQDSDASDGCPSPRHKDCESAKESDSEGEDSMLNTPVGLSPEKEDEGQLKTDSGGKREELVFRDAMKQLLIETLPPVLTLHLKRFLQEGRRLRKNGHHVEFPDVLDMAPFCVPECKAPHIDASGQALYSLYAVVEHAGGMQGGHYTAYVRVRDDHTHSTDVGGVNGDARTCGDERGVVSPLASVVSVGVCSAECATGDQRGTTENQLSAIADHSVANGPMKPNQSTTEVNQNNATRHNPLNTTAGQRATLEPLQTTANQTAALEPFGTTVDQTATVEPFHTTAGQTTTCEPLHTTAGQTATPEPPHTTADHTETKLQPNTHSTKPDQNFDLTPLTSGQWYHISDTRVRTATKTEVHQCQAYLLFYERLPFKHS